MHIFHNEGEVWRDSAYSRAKKPKVDKEKERILKEVESRKSRWVIITNNWYLHVQEFCVYAHLPVFISQGTTSAT